jgi:TetR/AcrR family transcriptional regulator, cholesterol catabolism regulator
MMRFTCPKQPFTEFIHFLTQKTNKTQIVFLILRPEMQEMKIKERIITEAGTLFTRYGIRSITMDRLAEEMGISKRTIYENFTDKDTLLMEVIRYFKSRQLAEAKEIILQSENVIVALFTLLTGMVRTMKQVNPLFFHDIKRYHAMTFRKMQEKGDLRDHSITERILHEGIEQDIFRDDLNMELVNLTIHKLFNLFSPDSSFTTLGFHRAELFDNIIIPYLLGIATEKGRKLIEQQEKIVQ